jgi:lipopolysaccharide export system permease protein
MATSRIDRYILWEIIVPTVLAVLIFTFVLLAGRTLKLAELVINKGIPLRDILQLLGYMLPSFLAITLPLSILLGTLLAFSRLSADAEIIALKAAGISLTRLLRPTMALALLASLATAGLTLYLEPQANKAFRSQIFKIVSQRANIGLQPRVFQAEFTDLVLYADEINDRSGELSGIFISDQRGGAEAIPTTIIADEGLFISDPTGEELILRLFQGQIHRYSNNSTKNAYQVVNFNSYDLSLPVGQRATGVGAREFKLKELSLTELEKLATSTDSLGAAYKARAEYHQRFSMAVTPLLFALLALPLGIQSSRSGRGGGFATGLVTYLIYYMCVSFSTTLTAESHWPAGLTIWAVPLIFLLIGILLFQLALHEKRMRFYDLITRKILGFWRPRHRGV